MKRLDLGRTWNTCPSAWQNLINHILNNQPGGGDNDYGASSKQINDALQQFNATYIEPMNRHSFVEFNDSQQYLLFMLRWS